MVLVVIIVDYCLKNMKNKILITGGNGFIGSHIVDAFLVKNFDVTCLVRESSNLDNLQNLNINIKYGDISKKESIKDAFTDVNFVIHNASYVKDWGDWETFYNINVKGTINVLELCLENGIDNVIMTGSISSYGEEHCLKIKDENSPFNSHYNYFLDRIFPCKMNYYRDTKRIATQKAMKFAKDNNINLTILEPVWVYGEREFSSGFFEYLKSVEEGMRFMPGSSKNKFHVVYVKDLAQAYLLVYEKNMQGVNRFIIGNEKSENMNALYKLFCKTADLKMPINIPKWIVYPIGFLLELFYTIFQYEKPPLLTRGRINMFYDNIEFSIRKVQNVLDFIPKYSLEHGIENTVDWYKENGYLK